jgi:hypothetical protein
MMQKMQKFGHVTRAQEIIILGLSKKEHLAIQRKA